MTRLFRARMECFNSAIVPQGPDDGELLMDKYE